MRGQRPGPPRGGRCLARALLPLLLALGTLVGGCAREAAPPAERLDLARDLLARGQVEQSLAEAKALLLAEPEHAEGRYLLGLAYLEAGDAAAAADQLARAEALGIPPARALPARARALVAARRHDEAVTLADADPVSGLPADAQGRLQYLAGRALAAQRRIAAARWRFDAAVGLLADPAPAHLGLARLALTGEDYDRARAHLSRVERGGVELWLLQGELALATGELVQARFHFNEVLRLRRDDLLARIGLARALLGQGELEAAATQLATAAQDHPEDARVAFLRVVTDLRGGNLDTAFKQVLELLARHQGYAPAMRVAGALHLLRGNLLQAEVLLAGYLRRYPADVTARKLLAAVHLQLRDPWAAIEDLEEGPEPRPMQRDMLELLGAAHLAAGRPEAAIEHLQRARSAAGAAAPAASARDDAGADTLLVLAFAAAGRIAEAEAEVEALAGRLGETALVAFLRGSIQAQEGHMDAARAHYAEALDRAPAYRPALLALAELARRGGDFVEACRRYREALATDENRHVLAEMADAGCGLDPDAPALVAQERAAERARGITGGSDAIPELVRNEGRPVAGTALPAGGCGGPDERPCGEDLSAEIQALLTELTRGLGGDAASEDAPAPRPQAVGAPAGPDPALVPALMGVTRVASETWHTPPPTLAFVPAEAPDAGPEGEPRDPRGGGAAGPAGGAPLAYRDPASDWSLGTAAPLRPLDAGEPALPGPARIALEAMEQVGESFAVSAAWVRANPVASGALLLLAAGLLYAGERRVAATRTVSRRRSNRRRPRDGSRRPSRGQTHTRAPEAGRPRKGSGSSARHGRRRGSARRSGTRRPEPEQPAPTPEGPGGEREGPGGDPEERR